MNTENTREIKVWDIGVRLFHWSLVAAFLTSYLSDELHDLHTWSGYAVIALLVFRTYWGFAGTSYARFSHFVYSPGEVMAYLLGIARGRPPHYTGHNPAGGWMILLMLITLTLVCFSGLKALAVEGEGPFARIDLSLISSAYAHGTEKHDKKPQPVESPKVDAPKAASPSSGESLTQPAMAPELNEAEEAHAEEEPFWAETHEALVNFMLLLVGIHLLGVAVSARLHRENLVRAMLTGRKHQR